MAGGRTFDLGIEGLERGTRIGEGGNAVVYRARQPVLDREVAVKVLKEADPDTRRRFDRERRAMGRLSQHDGIVTVYDSGYTAHEEPYLIMPLLEGSLEDELRTNGPMAWRDAVTLMAEVCETVAYAHEQGVVHRDLKPANLMRTQTGRPLVADFGISRITDASASLKSTAITLTPAFSPPEALEAAPAAPSADVYSLGATLYALLAGHPPFMDDPDVSLLVLMRHIIEAPIPPLPDTVPESVVTVVETAMAKNPAARYTDAGHMAAWLRHVLADPSGATVAPAEPAAEESAPATPDARETQPVGSPAAPAPTRPASTSPTVAAPVDPVLADPAGGRAEQRSTRLWAVVPVAVLVAALALAGWLVSRSSDSSDVADAGPAPAAAVDEDGLSDGGVASEVEDAVAEIEEAAEQAAAEADAAAAAAVDELSESLGDDGADDPADDDPADGADAATDGNEPLGDGSLGVVVVPDGEAIQIRSLNAITGPVAFLGLPNQRGVEIAIDDYGPVRGFPVDLGRGLDDLCSADGGQAAAQQIVADDAIVGVVGTSCSGAATAAAPLISDAGMVMVSPSNTSPSLTSAFDGRPGPNHHAGYYRTAHNDLFQGAAMAEFAFTRLGVQRVAAIHDGDPYTEGLVTAFAEAFERLGGEVVGVAGISPDDTDMVPVLTDVARGGPEALFFPVFQPAGDFIADQAPRVPRLQGIRLLSADGLLVDSFLERPSSEGMFFSGPDLRFGDSRNQSTGATADQVFAEYVERFGEPPSAAFWAHAYDATTLLLDAIAAASRVENGDLVIDRAGVREFLDGVGGYEGIIGTLSCDRFGDCGAQRITIVEHLDHDDVEAGKANVVFEYEPG